MARMPGADWRPIPENSSQASIDPNKVILHSAVGSGSLYDYFSQEKIVVESHFWVSLKGKIEQYLDTTVRGDANYGANSTAISIESADNGDPDNFKWTPEQVESIAHIIAWASEVHDIPIEKCTSATDSGIGYHSQFPSWSPVAKTCPGEVRIKQIPSVLARAKEVDVTLTDADIVKLANAKIARNLNSPSDPDKVSVSLKWFIENEDQKLDDVKDKLKELDAKLGALSTTGLTEAQLQAIVDRVLAGIVSLRLTK